MSTEHGWVSSAPGSDARLSDEDRASAERRREERQRRRGALLAIVQVRVFEHEEEPQVTFPPNALLGPEAEGSVISEVVQRAQRQLVLWR
jgi:hypothetical protein